MDKNPFFRNPLSLLGFYNFAGNEMKQLVFRKLSNGTKSDQLIFFNFPLVAFPAVGDMKRSGSYPTS
jgi:hypothetical protein